MDNICNGCSLHTYSNRNVLLSLFWKGVIFFELKFRQDKVHHDEIMKNDSNKNKNIANSAKFLVIMPKFFIK